MGSGQGCCSTVHKTAPPTTEERQPQNINSDELEESGFKVTFAEMLSLKKAFLIFTFYPNRRSRMGSPIYTLQNRVLLDSVHLSELQ